MRAFDSASTARNTRRSTQILAVSIAVGAVVALSGHATAWAQDGAAGTAPLTASAVQTQAAAPAVGDVFTKGGCTYRVTDAAEPGELAEVKLVKYAATNKKPVISTVVYRGQTYEVDKIAKNAFNNARGHRVVSVTLGRHVDAIGAKAFYGCSKIKVLNMAKADVIDIEKRGGTYRAGDIDIGAQAFAKAGTSTIKVNCGKSNTAYRKLYKQALMKKGMRPTVRVVK